MEGGELIYVVNGTIGNVVYIGFRHDLTDGSPQNFFDLPIRDSSAKYLERLTPFGKSLVQKLSKISGIKRVEVGRNDFQIHLSSAYAWIRDLAPDVKTQISMTALELHMIPVERRKRKPKKKTAQ